MNEVMTVPLRIVGPNGDGHRLGWQSTGSG